jgi:5-methylthioadenosine/S-adenosylhomocysteine deaminase
LTTRTERTLITGDYVATLGEPAVIADGAIIIEGGRITETGPRTVLENHGPFSQILGGPGYLLLPGFVNAHYHTECWTARGLIGTIFEYSNLFIGAGAPIVDEEALELLATVGLVHAVRGGQTTTVDAFYGKPAMPLLGAEPVLRAYEKVGLRTALGVTLRDQNIYAHQDDAAFLSRLPATVAAEVAASPLGYAWPVGDVLEAFGKLHSRWHDRDGRFRFLLAPDWTPACSDELFRLARRTASDFGTGLTTHVLETRSELMWNLTTHGKPAVRRLADLGVLGPDVSFSHFVWATDEDIAIVADTGVVVASNPGSNLRLSSGICRVRDLLAGGARVAFGTDGISFSDREDFFQELRLAAYLQRQPDVFSEHRLDSLSLLRSAGEAGAAAAGFPGELGRLLPGYRADVLMLRTSGLFFPPGRLDGVPVLDVLLDRASASDLDTVLVDGRAVMSAGRMTTVDESRLRDRLVSLGDRLYPSHPAGARLLELAGLLLPHAQEMYDQWYQVPIDAPASVYNTRRPPAATLLPRDERQVRVGRPLGERTVVQAGVAAAGQGQGEQVDGRRDAAAAVGDDRLVVADAASFERARQFGNRPETVGRRVDQAVPGDVDAAGDAAGAAVGAGAVAAERVRGEGVDQASRSRRGAVGDLADVIEAGQQPRPWPGGERGGRVGDLPGLHGAAGRGPGDEAPVKHADLVVPEVAKEPP